MASKIDWSTSGGLCQNSTGNPRNSLRPALRLAESVDLKGLFALQDALLRFRAMLSTPVNAQLLLEDVLLQWLEALKRKPSTV